MLEWLLGIGAPAAVVLVSIPLLRSALATWSTAARRLGFHYRPGLLVNNGVITARRDEWDLTASLDTRDSSKTRIQITTRHCTWLDLTVTPRGLFRTRRRVATGDEYFDARATVLGPLHVVFAALTPLVRRRLGRLLEDNRAEIRADSLVVRYPRPKNADQLVEWLTEAIELFERMIFFDVVGRLLDNLKTESSPKAGRRSWRC